MNVPDGMTVAQDWQWSGPATQRKTGLKIEISPQVKPGQYVFTFDVQINGEFYGTIPCRVTVVP
ncbi:MAG: hypothetical protein PHR56_07750 [Dehalococcoidales bacterium]|nr:hypothetical protein [Dehalococcoidales bacterium]